MTRRLTFTVSPEHAGKRIDAYLTARSPELSRTLAASLTREGRVLVNGHPVKPAFRVHEGDAVVVDLVLPPSLRAAPECIDLRIVYHDPSMAVIDKPAGLVVHPAPGHAGGTLANALVALYPQTRNVGEAARPGIVHRLDKDTSGLMAVALTPTAHRSLQEQIAQRSATRRYLALVAGSLRQKHGTIDAPIGRDPENRRRMAIHGLASRSARTAYRTLDEFDDWTLLEATLQTGRTHQIRVHLAALGHPIAGDTLYGGGSIEGLGRQFLHAYNLSLRSPYDAQAVNLYSALPADLSSAMRVVGGTEDRPPKLPPEIGTSSISPSTTCRGE